MKICDLIQSMDKYLDKPFVKELSPEKNIELAYATMLFAHKKIIIHNEQEKKPTT